MCYVNRDLKVNPIRKFLRGIGEEIVQYIGIAIDEPKRLARLKANQISLLAKYGYTEQMALELCRKYDLISPIYEMSTRGGCWFCPNVSIPSFVAFRDKHPDLWNELEALSHTPNLCSKSFKYEMPMHEVVKRMNDYKFQQSQPRLFDDEN